MTRVNIVEGDDDQRGALAGLPQHILSLTSARFIAAFAIVFFHFRSGLPVDVDVYTDLTKRLYLGSIFSLF